VPTGYTAIIEDDPNVTFQQFAIGCARAFGALAHMRDEPQSKPIEDRVATNYHVTELAKANQRLAELQAMTPEQKDAAFVAENERRDKEWVQYAAQEKDKLARYLKMRAQVVAWLPPTPEHDGLKKFMLEQIDTCVKHLGGSADYAHGTTFKPFPSVEHWFAEQMRKVHWDIEYHTREDAKEKERVASANKWVADLRASLQAYPVVQPTDYEHADLQRFVRDMQKAGLTPYHYHGRFFWEGPAVDVDDLQEALSETRVKCQHDSMGLGYVVYPRASGKRKEAA
jgi:hypothetical protein